MTIFSPTDTRSKQILKDLTLLGATLVIIVGFTLLPAPYEDWINIFRPAILNL